MLTISLFTSGILGLLQEKTYTKYGPHWKEGVFYTVRTHDPPCFPPPSPSLSLPSYLSSSSTNTLTMGKLTTIHWQLSPMMLLYCVYNSTSFHSQSSFSWVPTWSMDFEVCMPQQWNNNPLLRPRDSLDTPRCTSPTFRWLRTLSPNSFVSPELTN